ncbi:MAG: hypothetical protein NT120_04635 [Candidatus Aenigmarchaeota archaeon]|nr:hypothetical protein [Candidatus Aenigmarchaeota archaeon]
MKEVLAITAVISVLLFAGIAFSYGHGFAGKFNMTNQSMGCGGKLNLSTNFTEMRNDNRGNFEIERNQTYQNIKQKLGLADSATNSEIRTALNTWAEQNKDLLKAFTYGKNMPRYLPSMPPMHRRW